MRVVILADRDFATRERHLLRHIELGLINEGIRCTHVSPLAVNKSSDEALFTHPITYRDKGFTFTRKIRAQEIVDAIESESPDPVDVVHVFGAQAWTIGLDIAAQLGSVVALEVFSESLVQHAFRLGNTKVQTMGIAMHFPDQKLLEHFQSLIGASLPPSRIIPWGVRSKPEPRPILRPGQSVGIVVSPVRTDYDSLRAGVKGLAGVSNIADVMMVLDADSARSADIWSLAQSLNILDKLTLVPDIESQRSAIVLADLLLQTEAIGEQRTLTLDAMASSMTIVAARDPLVSYLIDGKTASLVKNADPAVWTAAILSLLNEPERARTLGAAAHGYIRENHTLFTLIDALIDSYKWICAEPAIPFTAKHADT